MHWHDPGLRPSVLQAIAWQRLPAIKESEVSLPEPMLGHLWDNLLRGSPRRNSISENGSFPSAGVAFGLLLGFQCCCTQSESQSLIHSPDQSCHPPFFHVPNHVSSVSPVADQGFLDLVVNHPRKPGWLKVVAYLYRMSLQTALHLSWCWIFPYYSVFIFIYLCIDVRDTLLSVNWCGWVQIWPKAFFSHFLRGNLK